MSLASPLTPAAVALHPHVTPVSGLLGVWNGVGKGSYPTLSSSFGYEEELHYAQSGKIFVSYTQRTWMVGTDRTKPMHEENGFLRFLPNQRVEALITQCTGVQEILLGTWAKDEAKESITITLDSTGLTRIPSAKPPAVTQTRRIYTFDLDGETLSYTILMATTKTPELTVHLTGEHTRAQPKPVAEHDEAEEEKLDNTFIEHQPDTLNSVPVATQTQ